MIKLNVPNIENLGTRYLCPTVPTMCSYIWSKHFEEFLCLLSSNWIKHNSQLTTIYMYYFMQFVRN